MLNDHLGDALWRVKRLREARFQWQHALTLNPELEDEERIKLKLQNGLTEKPVVGSHKKSRQAAGAAASGKKRVQTRLVPGTPMQ